jgi:flagellum-specific peptidoglycan hydrolase FlgJ
MPNRDFIAWVLEDAVQIQKKHNLPAAVITAQACLETGYGKHIITDMHTGQFSYNLFNIKGEGPAGSVLITTTEYVRGRKTRVQHRFRAYHNYEESFEDLAELMALERYKPCREAAGDPDEYARQLKICGYATDPQYHTKLIRIMNSYNLKERAREMMSDWQLQYVIRKDEKRLIMRWAKSS